jgi:hypothetical protein
MKIILPDSNGDDFEVRRSKWQKSEDFAYSAEFYATDDAVIIDDQDDSEEVAQEE